MIRLNITNPGPDGFVDYRRNFMVFGDIEADERVPADAVLTVMLFGEEERPLRVVRAMEKNNRKLFLKHPNLTGYREELDPGKEKLLEFGFPELIVRDLAHPEESLRDATLKAWYSDTCFKALVISATDAAHGLVADDGVGYTDENGAPYTALPMGEYRVLVTLETRGGKLLAETEKAIRIARQKNQLICRFNPVAHKLRMKAWAESMGIAVINDCLPGYLDPYLGTWYYHMGLLPMYRANDLASYADTKTHFFVYLIEEDSTSYETELSYLQSVGAVRDPERFQAYAYDIGEAVIGAGKPWERQAKILPFAPDEYLRICRVDTVNEKALENVFNLNEEAVEEMQTEPDSVTVSAGSDIAIMSVVRPFGFSPEDFVRTTENIYEIRNRIETLRYTFDDGVRSWTEERKLLMERIDGKSIGKSVFEAYNLFRIGSECAGKTVHVTMRGYDSRGQETPARGQLTLPVIGKHDSRVRFRNFARKKMKGSAE